MQAQKRGEETTVIEEEPKNRQIVLKKEEEPKEVEKHYLALKLPKKVTWSEDTVNNEGMGKKNQIYVVYIIDHNYLQMIQIQVHATLVMKKERMLMKVLISIIDLINIMIMNMEIFKRNK